MKISVYITSYNQKDYLVEAIESVLAQTLKPHQIIISDDCSTDGSREVIEGYRSRYPGLVTPVLHERNAGVARVRIDALNAVTGDWVTYVDGDDRLLPAKLEKECRALKNRPDARIAFSNYFYMDESGRRTGMWAEDEKPPEGYVFKETFARDFPKGNLFRKELVDYGAWKEIGFHDPKLNLYEDYEMRVRLTKKLKVVYHDEPLSEYRRHGQGLSKAEIKKHLDAFEYIFNKNKPLLDDLSAGDRRFVEERFNRWVISLARGAASESMGEGHYVSAARYYLKVLDYKNRQRRLP